MYYTGISHPNDEPRRNSWREVKKRSTFTEEVAANVTDGDLYFMQSSPAATRFYVPVEPEHGVKGAGDGELVPVTHKFVKHWDDMPGKWEPYDAGGNLVIPVRAASEEIQFDAMRTIESALYHTRLGRAIGHDALREMARSLAEAFGIRLDLDSYAASPGAFRTNPEQEQRAQAALKALLTFTPEGGYDPRLGGIGAEADGVGFAEDGQQYAALINGTSDGFDGEGTGAPLPLLSQPVFYAVLGYKGNGRSFQARIDELMAAVGLTEDDLR